MPKQNGQICMESFARNINRLISEFNQSLKHLDQLGLSSYTLEWYVNELDTLRPEKISSLYKQTSKTNCDYSVEIHVCL